MKRSKSSIRIFFLGVVVVVGMAALAVRLWDVQITRGAEFARKVSTGSQVTVRIPAVRGEILDRNGVKLVENRASFEVDFYLPDMVRAYKESRGRVPMTTYRGRVHNMPRDLKEADVVRIVSETVIPRLEELGVAKDYNSKALQIHYRTNREVPYNYRQDLSFEEMALFSEKNLGLAGVNVGVKPVRWYVYGALAPASSAMSDRPRNSTSSPTCATSIFTSPMSRARRSSNFTSTATSRENPAPGSCGGMPKA